MKIVQNIKLMKDLKLTTWLSEEHETTPLSGDLLLGPQSLSFHPWSLLALADLSGTSNSPLKAELNGSLRLLIIDDEEKKALIKLKSSHQTLLLFSEMLSGVFECAKAAGISIASIKTDPEKGLLELNFKWAAGSDPKKILGGALLMRAALDSLLFCRGLQIGNAVFHAHSPLDNYLQTIFQAQL